MAWQLCGLLVFFVFRTRSFVSFCAVCLFAFLILWGACLLVWFVGDEGFWGVGYIKRRLLCRLGVILVFLFSCFSVWVACLVSFGREFGCVALTEGKSECDSADGWVSNF